MSKLNYNIPVFTLILLLCGVLSYPQSALAAEVAGRVVSLYGDVWVSTGNQNEWREIDQGERLYIGDVVRTGKLSGARLIIDDESLVQLHQNTEFEIEGVRISALWRQVTALVTNISQSLQSSYHLIRGKLWMRNNNREVKTRIITSAATIGIRGTEFGVEADAQRSSVYVREGMVLAQNEQGEALVNNGEGIVAEIDQAPQQSLFVSNQNALQWTVRIPPLIDTETLLRSQFGDSAQSANLLALFAQTDYAEINRIIESQLTESPDKLDWRVLQAWVMILSGNSLSAYEDLRKLSEQSPANTALLDLTAFAALLNRDIEYARSVLNYLAEKRQSSDISLVITGYIQQLDYQLKDAMLSYQQALNINPESLIAKVSIAKLLLHQGEQQRALSVVEQVIQQRRDYLPARNLLGFIRLAQGQTEQAIKIWESVGLAGDAETHFGLALGYMQKGQSALALKEMASTVLLDPQNAMYLSYWGKMLYQVRRYDKALTVLDSAMTLDANDPTPRFYRALVLRELDQPGDAILDLHEAMRLNRGEMVNRSRSLLDQDLAVQNIDQSRLYTQLGLNHWARSKARDAIQLDYSNASAHLLNAGALAGDSDRSASQLDERLVAGLLAPTGTNSFSSFDQYSRLYEMPALEQSISFGLGSFAQGSLAYVASSADLERNLAWRFEAERESSDGWRDSNAESLSNLALSAKWQANPKRNYYASVSLRENDISDDLYPRFEFDAVSDPLAELSETKFDLELGVHQRLTAQHQLLGYFALSQAEGEFDDTTGAGAQERTIDASFDRPLTQLQLQGIFDLGDHQIIYGALGLNGKDQADTTTTFVAPPTVVQTSYNLNRWYNSFYLRDSWRYQPDIVIDAAIYHESMRNADALTGGEWSLSQSSPRLGVAWQYDQQNSFRAATFRYLAPFDVRRIDPGEVAGIPIYKNARAGSRVREWDLVWDYEWSQGLVSTNLYRLDEKYTSSLLSGGSQLKSTETGDKQGISVSADYLLNSRTGLSAAFDQFELDNAFDSTASRDEASIALTASHLYGNGLKLSAQQVFRELDFSSSRADETISLTNFYLDYDFNDKSRHLALEFINVFDQEFNWVNDTQGAAGFAPARSIAANFRLNF